MIRPKGHKKFSILPGIFELLAAGLRRAAGAGARRRPKPALSWTAIRVNQAEKRVHVQQNWSRVLKNARDVSVLYDVFCFAIIAQKSRAPIRIETLVCTGAMIISYKRGYIAGFQRRSMNFLVAPALPAWLFPKF